MYRKLETRLAPLLEEVGTEEQWKARRTAIMQVWLDYVGTLPKRSPIRVERLAETDLDDHQRIHLRYSSHDGDWVTAYLLLPNDGKREPGEGQGQQRAAILALHPTIESGKVDTATEAGRDNRRYGLELVQRGYVVLAPDTITAGERIEQQGAYRTAAFYERQPGWTAVGKMLHDHQYGLDLLCNLPEVDANRIGAIGHSLGGYNSFFLAGLDQRIRAFVSSCGFATFAGDPDPNRWGQRDWFSHIPRLTEDLQRGEIPFEFHEIAALAAPKPALYYSGQQDTCFPHWQVIAESMGQLGELYARLGHAEHFRFVMTNGKHDFPDEIRQLAYQFLDRLLA